MIDVSVLSCGDGGCESFCRRVVGVLEKPKLNSSMLVIWNHLSVSEEPYHVAIFVNEQSLNIGE